MMKIYNTAILILASVGWLGPHPAPAVGGQYHLGTTYQYDYQTVVQLNENPSSGREVGFKVTAKVSLTNVWQNPADPSERLMKLELAGAKLQVHSVQTKDHHLQDHSSALDSAGSPVAFVHWIDGRPAKIYLPSPAGGKDEPTADLLRGLAGLFQIHSGASDSGAIVEEDDVSGRCQVSYTRKSATTVEKHKWGCQHPQDGQFLHYNHIQSVTSDSKASYFYELFPDTSVKNLKVTERILLTVNLWRKASLQALSESNLNFAAERTGEKTIQASDVDAAIQAVAKKGKYTGGQAIANPTATLNGCAGSKCKPLSAVVKEYRERMKTEHLAKVKSANAFLRVLESVRVATVKDIESVLKESKNKKILPQLLDVVAAAQTPTALTAGLGFVDLNNVDQAERFLLGLGLTSHPDGNLITELLSLSKKAISSEKVKTTLLTTLGNLARLYCQQKGEQGCGAVVQKVHNYFIKSLEACEDDICRVMFLRGLVNSGLPNMVPTLIPYVVRGGKACAVALRALKRIGSDRLNETTVRVLIDVHHQLRRQYDSTCRTLAAEVLLGNRGKHQLKIVRDIVNSFPNQQTPEVNTFTLAKLLEMAETDEELASALQQVSADSSVWNYYTLAQNGVSAAYTRPFGNSHGANATYGINMEFLPGGVLKRSSFDVALQAAGPNPEKFLMLSVGLYAEGIGSFGGSGGDEDNEADKEETSAGMELTAFDMRLRPYTFFTGTGELMGLVWSGRGSEPTPALQANLLMNDHQQTTALHNGLPVELSLLGGLSADLKGSIQISLWNRNSHSLVKTSGALLLHGAARVSAPFVKSHLEFAMGGEAYVDFVTDLDFYEKPFKMCIQMDQKPFSFRYNVRKAESVPGSKHLIRTLRKRTVHVSGKSFAMHRKNMNTCSVMLEGA